MGRFKTTLKERALLAAGYSLGDYESVRQMNDFGNDSVDRVIMSIAQRSLKDRHIAVFSKIYKDEVQRSRSENNAFGFVEVETQKQEGDLLFTENRTETPSRKPLVIDVIGSRRKLSNATVGRYARDIKSILIRELSYKQDNIALIREAVENDLESSKMQKNTAAERRQLRRMKRQKKRYYYAD